ncbi:MAG: ABC transporter substrate binding protein [Betaproteobacteria bacterium ADurb.Bin341]|nr:MAG: ABC transporter substrate binding protein [Betaproteobacteria bacterium ADurb.Bin341]
MKLKMGYFLSALALLLLPLFPGPSTAAEPGNVYRLLIVEAQKGEPYLSVRLAMLDELGKLGFKEGSNLQVKYYSIGNKEGATKSIWDAESGSGHDVIFLNGTVVTEGFKKLALGDMKHRFVFGAVTDPVGIGVIDQFDVPPKANFTGVCYPVKVEERLRFIRQVMPHAKKIALIDAGMPQSHSYRKWMEDALKLPEFKDLKVSFRSVEFVKSEEGHRRMAELAKKFVLELDPVVDAFITPNDQMGVQQPFADMVFKTATKPLIGLSKKEITDSWGGVMALYPDTERMGRISAEMIKLLFDGQPIQSVFPRCPEGGGYAFDLEKTKKFGITIPPKLLEAAEKTGGVVGK